MLPVPLGRRDRFTSAVGPDASGSKPGIEWFQTPEKSGMDALPCSTPTVCPKAGVTTPKTSVTTNRKSRLCKCMFSSSLFFGVPGHLSHEPTPFACAFGRARCMYLAHRDIPEVRASAVRGEPDRIGHLEVLCFSRDSGEK